ncbi:hypothetical protein GOV12_04800 [Candidatus Pacearchaeota archaeon]|nr:hypothetical protein [Candidatus Pacearchaeota archaeon]
MTDYTQVRLKLCTEKWRNEELFSLVDKSSELHLRNYGLLRVNDPQEGLNFSEGGSSNSVICLHYSGFNNTGDATILLRQSRHKPCIDYVGSKPAVVHLIKDLERLAADSNIKLIVLGEPVQIGY